MTWSLNTHLAALSFTCLLYAVLAAAFWGWGSVLAKLLGLSNQKTFAVTPLIWMGWVLVLLIFQLLHFFLPLAAFAVIPVLAVGSVISLLRALRIISRPNDRPARRTVLIILVVSAVLLVTALYVASRSMLPPTNYDSGLYHLNKIRWNNTFAVVLGLGNLHGRLAFNQSFFAYAAALNFHPFFGHGRSIANSFLLLLTVVTFIELLKPVFRQPSLLLKAHPFRYLSIIIALPYLAYLAISSNGLASPTPDLASTLLQLVMIVVLARGLVDWKSGQRNQNFRAVLLALLAVTAVTLKLSNLAFSAVIVGIVLLYGMKPQARLIVARTLAFSALIILVWCLQGILLSGAPLYPSTIGYLPVEWAVPTDKVIDEANWIYSWARQPNTHWSNVLGSWNWLKPWFARLITTRLNAINVHFPLTMAILFLILTLAAHRMKNGRRLQIVEWAILLPPVVGLVYWFLSAPSPKFANALFFIISMCAILLFLSVVQIKLDRRQFLILFTVVLLLANINYAAYAIIKGEDVASISLSGWYPIDSAPLDERITKSGLLVYTPKSGDQSWDSPLPSTPYFNEYLELRDPQNMSAGFKVTAVEE